ncbi:ARM repeat-containing protein [Hypoxylon sp. FL0890]|nr:ARM repeat-containing protein [Hypoxylon sp. FL0890]
MNFSIEAPGAATPLTLSELVRTLQSAQSHDNSQRQAATQQLSAWETHPDYYPTLQSIFLDTHPRAEARLLAIIQLKNGIDRFWRNVNLKEAIPQESRQRIRERLFQGTIGEGDRQLALHNALATAKVVRIDYPQQWSTPLADLTKILRETKNGDQVQLSGALMLLLRIVKELGTARLRKSQTTLQSITPELVHVLCEIYDARTSEWIAFLTDPRVDVDYEGPELLAMENSLDTIKILRRLLLVGYEDPHKDNTVQQVWTVSQTHFAQFLSYINSDSEKIVCYHDFLGKHLMQFAKLHIEMSLDHPASFASLPNSFDLVRAYWDLTANFAEVYNKSDGIRQESFDGSKTKTEGPLMERLALKGLLLLRSCMAMVYHPKQSIRYRSKSIVQEQGQAIRTLKKDLLKDELILQIANVLITRLFIFRKADLDAWEEDPQEWEQQEEAHGAAYEWEVRPCAEKLFLDLLINYKRLLLEPLLSYFSTIQNPETDIITREAIYTAMGLAAPLVNEKFDFGSVLKTTIVADAQRTGPSCQVLRRRISILLSEWVPVNASKEMLPLVYEIFRHFLNPNDPNNDIVVRITTARLFKVLFDEFGFEGQMFTPFASDVLTQFISLLQEVEVDEAKLAILESTRMLIQRMETHVSQFGDMVMNAIPGIWQSAGELGLMMKQSVLAIIQSLVMSMRTESQRYQPMILPLIAEASQENTELSIYLIEEALELWSNVLHQSQPPLSPELLGLGDTVLKLLANQSSGEHTFILTSILGCYVLLAPEKMLEDKYRAPTLTSLWSSIGSQNHELVSISARYIDILIRLAHELGGTHGLRIVVGDMMTTGIIPKMLDDIHDHFEAGQTTGPKKREPRVNSRTLIEYFTILSRIAVMDPTMYIEMLATPGPLGEIWKWLSAEWFAAFDAMADHNKQKLNLLALTRFLELPQPMQDYVLLRLQDYFSMWTSVMLRIVGDSSPDAGVDLLVLTSEPEPTEWDTPKDVIERALFSKDPVKTVQSLEFVRERLDSLVNRVGGPQIFQEKWGVNVDKEILSGIEALIALPSGKT